MANGLQLLRLFDFLFLVAMAAWLGSILFVSFGVAPLIFRVLPAEHAARFVRALFPVYYAWGATSGAVALPATVCGPLAVPELRGPAVAIRAGLILLGVLLMFYAGNVLTPAINAARDAGPDGAGRFDRLHRRSVWLNGLALLLGLAVLALHVTRPAPAGTGIVEPTPQEIVQKRLEALERDSARKTEAPYGFPSKDRPNSPDRP
jgi:putative copper export protein